MILQSDLLPVTLKHAFTTRRLVVSPPKTASQGTEGANFRVDSINDTCKWWVKLRDRIFTPKHTCYLHEQVHGGRVRVVDPDEANGDVSEVDGFRYRVLGEGDAIIRPFGRKPVFLAITTADCLPCVVYDPNSGAVGVVHAGWRGLAADIPANTMRMFKSELGVQPKDLLWAIGPSIDVNNYEVGNEVIAALEIAGYAESDWRDDPDCVPGWVRGRRRDHYQVNLAALAAMRLRSLGVPSSQIDICALSTFENPNLFYSYRRDGEIRGLQATVIG